MTTATLWSALRRRLDPGGRAPIGLVLDGNRIELLQLEGSPQQPRVRACLTLDRADGGELLPSRDALRSLLGPRLRQTGFRGRRTVTAMPASQVKLMVVNYGLESNRDEAELILRLVAERVPQPLAQCVVDYLPIRTASESEKSALVAVAQRENVIGYLELLRAAGLQVEALEIEPVAMRRLVMRLSQDEAKENILVLNGGATRSDLTVFWGRRLILYRELEFGESRAVERLSRTLEMSPESAVSVLREYGFRSPVSPADLGGGPPPHEISQAVREILKAEFDRVAESVRNALAYTASRTRGGAVDAVYLVGSIVRWPEVEHVLQERLALPVEILDPRAAFDPSRAELGSAAPAPSAIVAGLALRGVGHES